MHGLHRGQKDLGIFEFVALWKSHYSHFTKILEERRSLCM